MMLLLMFARMPDMKQIPKLLAVAVIALSLTGCAGGGLGALLDLIAIGNAVGDIEDLFGGSGGDADEADVLLDGQVIATLPEGEETLRLSGLPEGRHLLQVVAGDYRGSVRTIDVDANMNLPLGVLQATEGGQVRGTVRTQQADGSTRTVARVQVYAIPGGVDNITVGSGLVSIPPNGTHYVAYTDGNGRYELSAMMPGDYLITAAIAGHQADARLVEGLQQGRRESDVDLQLVVDASVAAGRAIGNVTGGASGGSVSLGGASLRATPDIPFAPGIPQDTIDRIANDSGAALKNAPWFQWRVLATLTDAGGSYSLPLPPGTPRVDAFAYDYLPAYREPLIVADQVAVSDYRLEER